mgnify:CR=1 FL=1
MREVYIVSAVRTPIGKYGGTLRKTNALNLSVIVLNEVINRAGIDPNQVDEVIWGTARQSTEYANMARVAVLKAQLPLEISAYTVNRLCGSSLQALWNGYQQIMMGDAEVVIAGGVENMSLTNHSVRNGRWGDAPLKMVDETLEAVTGCQPTDIYGVVPMGMTAEYVAEKYNITREDQDRFALQSQQRAAKAINEGRFKDEIVPVEVKSKKSVIVFDTDEHPKPDTTLESLAKLRPAFKKDGTVTAGNSCGRNDAASAVIMMSGEKMVELGLQPMGRVLGVSSVGLDPMFMGMGPVPAVKKLLGKTGLSISDIDLVELNEAFAAQAIACIRELGYTEEKTNVNGSGIALGHPVGATGTRLVTTLLYEMGKCKSRYGIATLCIGGGQGLAALIENMRR